MTVRGRQSGCQEVWAREWCIAEPPDPVGPGGFVGGPRAAGGRRADVPSRCGFAMNASWSDPKTAVRAIWALHHEGLVRKGHLAAVPALAVDGPGGCRRFPQNRVHGLCGNDSSRRAPAGPVMTADPRSANGKNPRCEAESDAVRPDPMASSLGMLLWENRGPWEIAGTVLARPSMTLDGASTAHPGDHT